MSWLRYVLYTVGPVTARLRHLAIAVADVASAQAFFEDAFGMTKAGDAGRGVYMTDGVMNVALLHFGDDPVPGITHAAGPAESFSGLYHFGMWVDDLEEAADRVEAAGAEHVRGRQPDEPNRYYEVKYRSPDGLVFDLTTSGWIGALRDPEPASGGPGSSIESGAAGGAGLRDPEPTDGGAGSDPLIDSEDLGGSR